MLSITFSFPDAKSYSHYAVKIKKPADKNDFEEMFIDSASDYDEDPFEVFCYIDDESIVSVDLNGSNIKIDSSLKRYRTDHSGELDYNPSLPKRANNANVLKKTSSFFVSKTFIWNDVDVFDPNNVVVITLKDQSGLMFFGGVKYDDREADDESDPDESGCFENDYIFFYHPDQKWKSECL